MRASEVAPDSVASTNLIDGGIEGSDIANGAVTGDDLSNNSVGPAAIADNSVGSDDLANNSIGPADLASEQGAIAPTLLTCDGASNWFGTGATPRYWMDARRVVHLEGAVSCAGNATEGGAIFTMPIAYTPDVSGSVARFGTVGANTTLAQVALISDYATQVLLVYDGPNDASVDNFVGLDGITYRAVGPAP